ncbi:DUF6058 family natural product biosynthesis protein [Stenotrophomonas maltophilia]|uniref:DUF6058 family natural product biosynthesis protein n=1 Tax=Stenotrophomonas maltophilia TaxID=40324 RepID=UPI003D2F94C6
MVGKEMLQEELANATANGSDPHATQYRRDKLLRLIDDYAESSMPFSPAEYPRNSRKRLVDELRKVVVGV